MKEEPVQEEAVQEEPVQEEPVSHRLSIEVPEVGPVSGLLWRPPSARWLMVLAHGAGAGMEHHAMDATAQLLADRDIATLRYQFPYVEQGSRRPDRPPRLVATVRAAVARAAELAEGLPLLAGGRSMGGRMTSTAQSEQPLPGVQGLVFFAFPLHPAGKPATTRATHLENVTVPMLFLQGTRDKLADLELLTPICHDLGSRATLHVVDGADHSFAVLKRSGRTPQEVWDELGDTVVGWSNIHVARTSRR